MCLPLCSRSSNDISAGSSGSSSAEPDIVDGTASPHHALTSGRAGGSDVPRPASRRVGACAAAAGAIAGGSANGRGSAERVPTPPVVGRLSALPLLSARRGEAGAGAVTTTGSGCEPERRNCCGRAEARTGEGAGLVDDEYSVGSEGGRGLGDPRFDVGCDAGCDRACSEVCCSPECCSSAARSAALSRARGEPDELCGAPPLANNDGDGGVSSPAAFVAGGARPPRTGGSARAPPPPPS